MDIRLNAIIIGTMFFVYLILIRPPGITRILASFVFINSYAIYPLYVYVTNDNLYAKIGNFERIDSSVLIYIYVFIALFMTADILTVKMKCLTKRKN